MKKNKYFVVVTERDCPDFRMSTGAMVHEMQLTNASYDKALERKQQLGDRFGKAHIARLIFDDEASEIIAQRDELLAALKGVMSTEPGRSLERCRAIAAAEVALAKAGEA